MDIYQEYLKRAEGLGDTALLALQKELLLPAVMEEKAAFVKAEYGRLQQIMGAEYSVGDETRVFHPLPEARRKGDEPGFGDPEELTLEELAMLPHLRHNIPRLGTMTVMPEMIKEVRRALGSKIFMYTFRDKRMGGEHPATCMYVTRLNDLATAPGLADLITVEWYAEPDAAEANIGNIHAAGKLAVASWCAQGEAGRDEIVKKLESMLESGADILEYCVMAESATELDAAIAAFKLRNPESVIIRSVISDTGEDKTIC